MKNYAVIFALVLFFVCGSANATASVPQGFVPGSVEPNIARPGPTDYQLISLQGFRIDALEIKVNTLQRELTIDLIGSAIFIIFACFVIRRKK